MRPETGANTLCRTLALRDIHIIAVLQSVRRTLRIVHQVQPTIQAMTYVLHPTQKLAVRDIHLMAQTMCATNPRNVRAVHSMHHGISAGMIQVLLAHQVTHTTLQRQDVKQYPCALPVLLTMQTIIVVTRQRMLVVPLVIHGMDHIVYENQIVLLAEATQQPTTVARQREQ